MTSDAAVDLDDDEARVKASTSPGNLDLALRILAAMCDGQHTELQASDVISHVTQSLLVCPSLIPRFQLLHFQRPLSYPKATRDNFFFSALMQYICPL